MFVEAQPRRAEPEAEPRVGKAEESPVKRAGRGKPKSKTLRPGLY